ncbi:hypothetical protein POTOM_056820 [Populus tomentosa]|uniref:Response regulatory domain-containing protein n=1 Tax=Populus tomentosa TaxID=118781 RepID=A0A8X7XVZ1_POPTO|nr:hypothetical protein POTOM_056820 [Populus tomentosa]
MTVEQGIGDSNIDQFPSGMRVLAVDDDPTCLLLLETLLRRCQYNGFFEDSKGKHAVDFLYGSADFLKAFENDQFHAISSITTSLTILELCISLIQTHFTAPHMANGPSHFQPVGHPGNNGNILQGMPMPLELDQIQSNKGVNYIPELRTHLDDTASFPVSSGSTDMKIIAGSSNSPFVGVSNKHLMLEGHGQGLQDGQKSGKQSSLSAGSLNPGYSSHFPDHGRHNDNWSNAVQSNAAQSDSFTLDDYFKQSTLHPSAIRDRMSTMALQSRNNPCDVSSVSTLPIYLQDSKADLPCRVGVATVSSNAGRLINNGSLGWDDHRQDDPYHSNGLSNSINSAIPINGNGSPIGFNLDPNNLFFQRTTSFISTGPSNFADTSLMKHNEPTILGQDKVKLPEGDFGCGGYSLRNCI